MELNLDTRFPEINRAAGPARSQFTVKPKASRPSFPSSEALQDALRRTPDARESEVARATQLVSDANYPPLEGIHKLASLLAMQIQQKPDE